MSSGSDLSLFGFGPLRKCLCTLHASKKSTYCLPLTSNPLKVKKVQGKTANEQQTEGPPRSAIRLSPVLNLFFLFFVPSWLCKCVA